MEVGPNHRHGHNPSLTRAGSHFEGIPPKIRWRQILVCVALEFRGIPKDLTAAFHRSGKFNRPGYKSLPRGLAVLVDEILGVTIFNNLGDVNKSLDCLALTEVIPKRCRKALDFMVLFEPVSEQVFRNFRGTDVTAVS